MFETPPRRESEYADNMVRDVVAQDAPAPRKCAMALEKGGRNGKDTEMEDATTTTTDFSFCHLLQKQPQSRTMSSAATRFTRTFFKKSARRLSNAANGAPPVAELSPLRCCETQQKGRHQSKGGCGRRFGEFGALLWALSFGRGLQTTRPHHIPSAARPSSREECCGAL